MRFRRSIIAAIALSAVGCLGDQPVKPSSKHGSFTIIEGAVNDICANVLDKRYRPTGDMGSDSDRIGFALADFMKSVEGTPLAADAAEIAKKINELERLAATRAKVEKQREVAKALQETVAAIKAKL